MRVITQYGKVKSQPSTRDNAVTLRKNSSGSPITRRKLNLIEGSGVTLTLADDIAGDEADVTVSSTATSTDRMRYRGIWNSATAYEANDVVLYASPVTSPNTVQMAYIAVSSSTNVTPLGNLSQWAFFSNSFITSTNPPGIIVCDSSGTILFSQLSGDVTSSIGISGEIITTLANTGVTPGTYTPLVGTVNSKGLLTSASTATASNLYTVMQVQRLNFGGIVSNTTTTLADITGLSFSALANKTYFFVGVLGCVSVATTTGIGFSISGSAGTITTRGQFTHMTAATTQGGGSWISNNSTKSISTGVITANEQYPIAISGTYLSTSDSTAQFRFRSEIATSEVNIQNASIVVYQMD